MLLSPAIPMLFMGEEWGSKTPFPFFCDFKGDWRKLSVKAAAANTWAYAEYGDEMPDALDLWTSNRPCSTGASAGAGAAAAAGAGAGIAGDPAERNRPCSAGTAFRGPSRDRGWPAEGRLADGRRGDARLLANLSDRETPNTAIISREL